ncbi:MAG TPA: acetoin utilization protein AcuC, partial [Frankiaceae bacterium]|nr:acetoin utilization protein AcuC [Frankiaceae bacterium]
FPGTGFADEIGAGEGRGTSVNVALPPRTDDAQWLRAFDGIVPPLLRAYRPQVLVTQLGCDTHTLDPLAHLALSVDGQRATYALLHALAHELTGGRWVVLGGGGYEIVHVVPRAWTHALAEVTGDALEGGIPEDWQELARSRSGEYAPTQLLDGKVTTYDKWDGGDPHDAVDRAIAATRKSVFPLLGLSA